MGTSMTAAAAGNDPDEIRSLRAEVAELRAQLGRLVDGDGHVTCRALTVERGGASVEIVVQTGSAVVKVDNGGDYRVEVGAEDIEGTSLAYVTAAAEGMSGITVSASPPGSHPAVPGQHRAAWGELQIFQAGGARYVGLADDLTKTERIRTGRWIPASRWRDPDIR
jgi:hypothetical protein